MRVIAKAYGDEPLDRVVVGYTGKLAYIVNQSTLSSGSDLAESGVGFPSDCVFEFEENLFAQLAAAHSDSDLGRLHALWLRATPFRSGAMLAA